MKIAVIGRISYGLLPCTSV